ncbi:MAG: EAL domain-containing protein, partial [Cyanobacteria bacterium P01_A01_bin.17]
LFSAIWQSRRKQRRSFLLLLCCGLVPLLLNFLTLSPLYDSLRFFDLTPIGLAISTVLFCWGLSQYQILQRSPLAYQQIFASLKASILVLDFDYRLIEFNAAAETLLGCTKNAIGESALELVTFLQPSDWNALRTTEAVEVMLSQQYFQVEQFPILRKKKLLGYILSFSDVTQSRQLQEQLLEGALLYDALTGLPNRTLFYDRLRQAIKRCDRNSTQSIAIAFVDVDRFKVINDSLGHLAGDQVLIEVAKRLHSCLRSEDTVARFGGDEFAILAANAHPQDIEAFCKRLQRTIQEPITLETHVVNTSASIGIVLRASQRSPEQLVQDADIAMYQAKSKGKGMFAVFEQSIANATLQRMELEVSLRQALERQEFFLVFQPIVAISSGEIRGFEALLRWQHPTHGLISPTVFIPIAEEMGIISVLDRWVLKNACQQLQQWRVRHPELDLTMSVNLSTANFIFANLVETVTEILNRTQVAGKNLKLEITESILMKDPEATARVLTQLKDCGVEILLDDFGTGHSSLSYLHRLPLEGLKIDKSFVHEAQYSPQSMEIIKTIVSLAQGLKLKLIAEGIETDAQRRLLLGLGCNLGQGYLWWKPMTSRKASNALRHRVIAQQLRVNELSKRL